MKIALADDQPLDLKFLMEYLISMNHQIVFCANDGESLLQQCKDADFDFLITDLYMPKLNALDVISEIHHLKPQIKVIVVSNNSSSFVKNKLLQYPFVQYVTKYKENYFEEIGALLSVKKCLTQSNLVDLLLTDKEKVVFKVLLSPKSTFEVCQSLNLSKKNLERYKTSIYHKLEVKNRTQLISQFIHLLGSN